MPVASSIVRALVRRYPRAFRERYAREVEQSTRALIHGAWRRGIFEGVKTTANVIVDLAKSVLRERRLSKQRGDVPRGGRLGMGSFGQDLRGAFRQIKRTPGFAGAAILTLSLAMGGVTAVFTIADPVLFRPLPYPDSDRLVRLGASTDRGPVNLFTADYVRLLADRGAFAALATAADSHLGILDDQESDVDPVFLTGVSPEFFDVFGVEPIIGRRFRPEEHRGEKVAIITHALWQSFYAGRPDILGQRLELRGSRPVTFEIVGVLPPGFILPSVPVAVESASRGSVALTPADYDPNRVSSPNYRSTPYARMRDGTTGADATATLQRAMAAVESSSQEFRELRRRPTITPLRTAMYAGARTPMFMLLLVTAFVMLLASANLAHLFMARMAGRAREFATRRALGASRARLVRMLVVEAGVVAAAGAAGALLLGHVLKGTALGLLPIAAHAYSLADTGIGARVFALVAIATSASLAGFGLLPALGVARRDLRGSLMATSSDRSGGVKRSALVIGQTATAVAVVLTAVLLVVSFARLALQDLGFNPEGVQSVTIASPANVSGDAARLRRMNLELKRRVEQLSGTPVALVDGVPGRTLPMGIGRLDLDRSRFQTIGYRISAEFFEVFEIRLRRGRLMTREESLSDAPVVVVDERAAALSWPGEDPLGQQMRDSYGAVRTVVGVVGALQTRVFSEGFQRATAFVPLPGSHRRYPLMWRGSVTTQLAQQIRASAREVDPQATALVGPLNLLDRQLEEPRFLAILLGALGVLAIALTVVGLYGVVSHGVAQRTREMGIRIALGAEASRIARLVVLQTLKPAMLGVGLGLALSLWWTESLRALLFGFTPHDWRVFAAAGLLVLALVGLACVMPVRRATRVDPLIALKAE